MTLHGTLHDLGIVDLVQFPNAGRKSGELIIVSADHHARLYYGKGQLVHAVMDNTEGTDVLLELLGWQDGEFEFRQNVEPGMVTIEADLHQVVMQALKQRDERKLEEDRQRAAETERHKETNRGGSMDHQLCELLDGFVTNSRFAVHAWVLDLDGTLLAETTGSDGVKSLLELRDNLVALLGSYPRKGLLRLFIEDVNGTVVLQRLEAKVALLVLTDQASSLGAVSLGVGKLAKELNGRTAR